MTRYQALRLLRADPLTAAAIAFLNWLFGAPANEIRFMHLVVEIDDIQEYAQQRKGE